MGGKSANLTEGPRSRPPSKPSDESFIRDGNRLSSVAGVGSVLVQGQYRGCVLNGGGRVLEVENASYFLDGLGRCLRRVAVANDQLRRSQFRVSLPVAYHPGFSASLGPEKSIIVKSQA
jgi:hypothetical protein